MIKKSTLRHIINDIKRITFVEVSIYEVDGKVLSSTTDITAVSIEELEGILMKLPTEEVCYQGMTIMPIRFDEKVVAYLILHIDSLPEMVKNLCVSQLESSYQFTVEKFNKESLIRKVLTEEVDIATIELLAEKVGMEFMTERTLYLIECDVKSTRVVKNLVEQMYEISSDEFVLEMGEGKILFGKTHMVDTEEDTINDEAYALVDTIEAELMTKILVAYSSTSEDLYKLKESYDHVITAIGVGKSFYHERKVISYNDLGVGRLVYGLPTELSETFLKEVLQGRAIEQFDDEIMNAVHKFFFNNLNISETARQLYVHRNTLVYRLGKVEKKTGLDIRLFDDALTFKMALMVSEHLKNKKMHR